MPATLLIAALVAGRPAPLRAQVPPTIDSVAIETRDIYDRAQAGDNFLAGLMNALHARTRPGVVRREVLVREGEPVDGLRLAETERVLRRLGIFREVSVDTLRVGNRLVARVVTHDGWTTSLDASLNATGGAVTWSAGLTERNLLGMGHLLGGSYRKEVDRDAWRAQGQLNRVFGSRAAVGGYYDNLSDGRAAAWNAGFPSRALSDRVELVLRGQVADERVLRFRDGVAADTLWHRALIQEAAVSWAPVAGSSGYVRVGVFGAMRRQEYLAIQDTAVAVADSVYGLAGAWTELLRARFIEVTHYNGFARDEDIDLGTRVVLGFALALPSLGYARAGVFPLLEARTGAGTPGAFVRLDVTVNGLVTAAALDSGQVRAGLTLASRLVARQATVVHVEAGVQKNPVPGAEFDLGHGLGPRAFAAHEFTGTRTVWAVVEHRVFLLDALLGLVGLGVAGFADYGGAWYGDQPPRLGGDVGLGIRAGTTGATGPNVGRLDLGYRFGHGVTGRRWVVSLGQAYEF